MGEPAGCRSYWWEGSHPFTRAVTVTGSLRGDAQCCGVFILGTDLGWRRTTFSGTSKGGGTQSGLGLGAQGPGVLCGRESPEDQREGQWEETQEVRGRGEESSGVGQWTASLAT